LVAVTVVTTVGAVAVCHPGVHTARELTNLRIPAGTLARTGTTDVALVACTTIATGCGLPGVLGRSAGSVTGLEVARSTAIAVARSTSITVCDTALTAVIAVGTLARTNGVRPGTVVLTGLEVRLTAVLVTHLLTAGVVGLVEGVVRTVAISSASRSITARATGVLASPGVVSLRAIKLTGLCISVGATLSVGRAVMTDTSETAVRTGGGVPAVVAAAVHHTKLLVAT
jgi:hypothetical protein